MVHLPMADLVTADDPDVSAFCDECGLRKEPYQLFDQDGQIVEPPRFELVCPREWAHGPADS